MAETAIKRLRFLNAPMTTLNFELWFAAEEYPDSPLAAELRKIEARNSAPSGAHSEELASRYLPNHRLAREARESGEKLAAQLEVAETAIATATTNQKSFGRSLALGASALGHAEDASALKQLVSTLQAAVKSAQTQAQRTSAQLAAASAEVGQLREQMEVIRREAATDALTGLANRRAFDTALVRACRTKGAVTVAMVDVDHFKRVNDRFGHATGDQVLRFVAASIGRTAHAPRLAARYGGEEFAILFPGETTEAVMRDLRSLTQTIRSRVMTLRSTGEQLGSVTVSIGVSTLEAGMEPSALVEKADEALYVSKAEGRDRITNAATTKSKAA